LNCIWHILAANKRARCSLNTHSQDVSASLLVRKQANQKQLIR
jgi:hypothetical protein